MERGSLLFSAEYMCNYMIGKNCTREVITDETRQSKNKCVCLNLITQTASGNAGRCFDHRSWLAFVIRGKAKNKVAQRFFATKDCGLQVVLLGRDWGGWGLCRVVWGKPNWTLHKEGCDWHRLAEPVFPQLQAPLCAGKMISHKATAETLLCGISVSNNCLGVVSQLYKEMWANPEDFIERLNRIGLSNRIGPDTIW